MTGDAATAVRLVILPFHRLDRRNAHKVLCQPFKLLVVTAVEVFDDGVRSFVVLGMFRLELLFLLRVGFIVPLVLKIDDVPANIGVGINRCIDILLLIGNRLRRAIDVFDPRLRICLPAFRRLSDLGGFRASGSKPESQGIPKMV